MDLLSTKEDEKIRALVQLLKAQVQTKSMLNFQISQLKIKNNYRQSNTDFKDFKDMLNLNKIIDKKVQDLKSLQEALKSSGLQKPSYESVGNMLGVLLNFQNNISEIDAI